MINLHRVGSKENPLDVVQVLSKRRLFKKIRNKNGNLLQIDKAPRSSNDIFMFNVISNPALSCTDIRIAGYLYERLKEHEDENSYYYQFKGNGMVFTTTDNENYTPCNSVGDEDGSTFWVSNNSYFDMPFPNLIKELKDIKLHLTGSKLIKSLNILHDFNYITITTIHGNKGPSMREKGKRIRSNWRHISINVHMVYGKVFNYWSAG